MWVVGLEHVVPPLVITFEQTYQSCDCSVIATLWSGTWSMLSSPAFYPNMEGRSRASSNEFYLNHRMNHVFLESSTEFCLNYRKSFARIIEWIQWLNCLINVGENRMQIKASNRIFLQVCRMYWTKSNIFEFYCQFVEIIKRTYTTSNIDTFRQPYTCSISNQRGQAIEFVDRPVPGKL